jgi:hypothetical protein
MSLTDKIHEIRLQLDTAEKEINSLSSGRKASASRARKSLQLIKGLSHVLRKEIVNFTKQLPTKKRSVDEVAEVPIAEEVPVVLKKVRKAKANKAI